MRLRFNVVMLIVVLALLAGSSLAQDYRATVQGLVTDSTQAAIAGAAVALRNENTGVEFIKHTNETGWYTFGFVEPGSYRASSSRCGAT